MDDYETAWKNLEVGLAPSEDRFWWLSSAAVSAWRKLGVTINNLYTSSNQNALDNASVSEFLGGRMVASQYLTSSGGGHQCAFFQRTQLGLVRQQQPKIERDHIVGDLSDLIVGWELYVTYETQIVAEAAGAGARRRLGAPAAAWVRAAGAHGRRPLQAAAHRAPERQRSRA